jgi:hypothetical protein
VLGKEVDGLLRQGVPVPDPELPADIGVNVFGVEAYGVQHTDRLRQDGLSDAVPRHADYGVFGHVGSPHGIP